MKLRPHLLVLRLGTLLPMFVFAVVACVLFARRARSTFQRGATERTLALLTVIDTELRGSITTLQALATSRHLETDGLRAFHDEAARALASQPGWFTITGSAAPNDRKALTTCCPDGDARFAELLASRWPASPSHTPR
jgi:sensor domain CHASE-containing protein